MAGICLPLWGSVAGRQGQPDPDELPSLNLWYNASASSTDVNGVSTQNFGTVVVNGTDISSWNDLSGTGHASNVTGGSAPQPSYATNVQNGLGMVQYVAANNDNLDINPIAWAHSLPGFTIYVVARPTSYAALFPLATTESGLGIRYDGTNIIAGAGGGTGAATAFSKNTTIPHIFGMVFDGAATGNSNRLKFRIDGAEQTLAFTGTVGTTTNATAAYFFFGGENRPGITLGFMNGYIGEVMMWTRALNTAEYLGAESYLNRKWGLLV